MMFALGNTTVREFQPWQLKELDSLGKLDPGRLEELLQALWNRYPFLYEELAIRAVGNGTLSVEEVSSQLHLTPEVVQEKLEHFYNTGDHRIDMIGGVARLVSSQVAVWEVYRDFEKSGSLDQLMTHIPGIPISELKAALRYAEAHIDEIRASIEKYESAYRNRFVV